MARQVERGPATHDPGALLWTVAVAAAAAALWLVPPPPGRAFVEDPTPGHTGGFGEPTCRSCHFDNPPDDPQGALRLGGVPERAASGATYRLAVVLERPGLERGGFQLAARLGAGERRGEPAGRLEPVDERVRVTRVEEAGVAYAHHTPRGTFAEVPGELRWELDWTAPDDLAGPVRFHVAANASNYDDSELGDFIYTAEADTSGPLLRGSPAQRSTVTPNRSR